MDLSGLRGLNEEIHSRTQRDFKHSTNGVQLSRVQISWIVFPVIDALHILGYITTLMSEHLNAIGDWVVRSCALLRGLELPLNLKVLLSQPSANHP